MMISKSVLGVPCVPTFFQSYIFFLKKYFYNSLRKIMAQVAHLAQNISYGEYIIIDMNSIYCGI